MELPSEEEYPDYYEVIKHPIALEDIKVIGMLTRFFVLLLFVWKLIHGQCSKKWTTESTKNYLNSKQILI